MTIISDKIATPDKAALRRRFRATRLRLSAKLPDAGERAAKAIPLDRLPSFGIFGGYVAMGGEIDPLPLMRRLISNGGRPALPVTTSKTDPLIFRSWNSSMTMTPDAMGIMAPPAWAAVMSPRLVIVPLLAFDRKGGRLGQGAGHYDRTLAKLREGRRVFVLGLAYAGQEVDEIPTDPHDQRLDAILTETGYIEVKQD
jgi:5-formyltetrahydrofolate cyclo-ligase